MALTTVTNQRVRNGNDSLVIPINAYDSTIPSANHVMQIVSRQQQPYQACGCCTSFTPAPVSRGARVWHPSQYAHHSSQPSAPDSEEPTVLPINAWVRCSTLQLKAATCLDNSVLALESRHSRQLVCVVGDCSDRKPSNRSKMSV